MRVLVQVQDVDIVELDVEVLVDGFQCSADANVIFELDDHGLVCEGLEETEKEHGCGGKMIGGGVSCLKDYRIASLGICVDGRYNFPALPSEQLRI